MASWLSRLRVWWPLAAVWLVFFWVFASRYDPDFGWHLQAGRYFLSNGIPSHDVFTYTASKFSWIDHEWLNDAAVAIIYRFCGYLGLAAIFAGLWVAALRLSSRNRSTIMLLAAFAVLPYAGVRTITWSVLLLAVLNLYLEQKRYWLIPPLLWLWSNLHGSFVLGLVFLLGESIWLRSRKAAISLLLSVLFTLANPYGPRIYIEVFRTLLDTNLHRHITEWASFYFPWPVWLYLAAFIAVLILYRPEVSRKLAWSSILGVMSVASSRHLPLLINSSTEVFETSASRLRKDFLASALGRRLLRPWFNLVLVTAPLIGYMLYYQLNLNPDSDYPSVAVSYLRQHPCTGNIFNTYDYGGYLIWRLGRPVYIDGRMPSWQDSGGQTYLSHYFDFLTSAEDRKYQIKKYDIRCMLLPPGRIAAKDSYADLAASIKHEGWREVFSSETGNIWER